MPKTLCALIMGSVIQLHLQPALSLHFHSTTSFNNWHVLSGMNPRRFWIIRFCRYCTEPRHDRQEKRLWPLLASGYLPFGCILTMFVQNFTVVDVSGPDWPEIWNLRYSASILTVFESEQHPHWRLKAVHLREQVCIARMNDQSRVSVTRIEARNEWWSTRSLNCYMIDTRYYSIIHRRCNVLRAVWELSLL